MSNCGNRIKKKQIDWVPYTIDPNEFCTISPGGNTTPALDDYLLIEDTSNSNAKACITFQQLKDLLESTGGVAAPYDCKEDAGLKITNSESFVTVYTFTTKSLPAGDYRISWTYFWNTSKPGKDFLAEIYVDNVLERTHIDSNRLTRSTSILDFGNTCNSKRLVASSFICRTFGTESTHLIEIKIRTTSTTYTSNIWDVTADILKVN